MLEQPEHNDDAEGWFSWLSHSETISVRGDGYMIHIEQVYKELFFPHNTFFEENFNFSVYSLFDFCTNIEKHIYSKIANTESIYGAYKAWERWKDWMDKKSNYEDSIEELFFKEKSDQFMRDFLNENPDLAGDTENLDFCVLYRPDDYKNSDKIFWIVPQNEEEKNILEALSSQFGENASFLDYARDYNFRKAYN